MKINHVYGNVLSWVQGNDVWLKVRVYEKYLDQQQKTQERAYDLTACDEVTTTLVTTFTGGVSVESAIDQTEDNCLVLHLPHTLSVGQYSTEIVCKKDGLQVRSFRWAFAIVGSDCEAQTTFEEVDGCRSASMRVSLQVVSQVAVRGKSAYEEWRELPGNEDKGLQDFIDEVLDLNSLATRAAEAAEAANAAAAAASAAAEGAGNVDAELSGTVLTVTDRLGVRKSVDTKGEKGDPGEPGTTDYNELTNKPTIPSKTSELANDSGFIVKTVNDLVNYYLKSETYTKAEVQALIAAIRQFTYRVVSELPTASADTMHIIYLVPSADPQARNVKDEYITIDNGASATTRYTWEQIGSTAVDLSGYYTSQQTDAAITTALNTALADYTTTSALTLLLAAKQDVISDLATIRSGAAAGATAYQKPQGGIPSTDMSDMVKASLGKADSALQSQEQADWSENDNTKAGFIKNKPTIPTVPVNVSDFTNDAGYITKSVNDLVNYYLKQDVYTKTEVADLIAAIQQFHYEIYNSTSAVTEPAGNVLYLIGPTGSGSDKYEEYVYDATKQEPWVKIGDTSIDLSGYYTSAETDTAISTALNTALADYTTTAALTLLLAGKQDSLTFNTAPSSSNKVATMADMPTVMHASGSGHKGGLVPDTPAEAGTTKFLREDGTWAENSGLPSGGSAGDVLTMSSNGAAWVAQAGIQDIDNLPSTGGAEIGYEIVSIVVTVDSGAPQGTTKSGLVINAYYNGATVPSDVATTDSDGFAQLLVPMGYQYKLVFPTQQGCRGIADMVHTASVAQRSVEVEYQEYVVSEGEIVRVVVEQKNAEVLSRVADVQITVTYDGTSTTYTTDSTGTVQFIVPYGKQYTITAPHRENWYLHENRYTLNLTAEQTNRVVTFVYRSYESGLTIIASDGAEFTLGEWEAAVEAGTRQNSEAVLIKISTGQLAAAGGVFCLDIDMVRGRTQGSNRAWASQNVQFNSVPLNGNSTSAAYYYDGLSASRLIQQEGDERSIDTLAADQCLAMSRTIAAGTESELTLPGFLGSVGQWNELWKNVAEIDDILLSTRPNGTYLMSTWTTSKWTCTQSNAIFAYFWGAAASNLGKNGSSVVLPFFAY